jgi:hypothetical protein
MTILLAVGFDTAQSFFGGGPTKILVNAPWTRCSMAKERPLRCCSTKTKTRKSALGTPASLPDSAGRLPACRMKLEASLPLR